jgi:hypothetical protein
MRSDLVRCLVVGSAGFVMPLLYVLFIHCVFFFFFSSSFLFRTP